MKIINKFTKYNAGIILQVLLALLLSSCASMSLPSLPSLPSSKPENYPIYEVMTERAPFYHDRSPEGFGGGKSYPYLYLPKGTTVTMLNTGKQYGQVSLINGMKGWMPISTMAPQMATGLDQSSGVTPVSVRPAPAGTQGNSNADAFSPDRGVKLPSY